MASNFVKNKMRRMESKKSHSWWWDSHISPRNSKWLQENLEEMDQHVKRMLKLIEEDADSFAKKAEMYYQKRPELISLVEDFYRMYRSLAERYDNVTGELRKNIPLDLQSQGSGISDVGSEPTSTLPSPERRPSQRKSGPRAAGFDFFLGSGGSGSDLYNNNNNNKEGDESSTLDSESDLDDLSVNNYSGNDEEHQVLQRRIIELEIELREVKEKILRVQDEEISYKKSGDGNFEYEEELRVAKEKIQLSEEEIARLTMELQKYKSLGNSDNQEDEVSDKVASLSDEIIRKGSTIENLQDELKSAKKEVTVWKSKVEKEKREVSKLQDRITRYKNNLSERDQEIRGLKEAICNANKSLSEENEQLQAEMTRMSKERVYLEDNLKEVDLRRQSLEEDVRRIKIEKEELLEKVKRTLEKYETEKDNLNMKIDALSEEVSLKDDEIDEMSKRLHELRMEHVELIQLRARTKELEREVENKQETIVQGAEEKREAIRQLCFSLEHYRNGYHRLREAVMGHKRLPVMAS